MAIALVRYESLHLTAYDEHGRKLFAVWRLPEEWDIVNWTAETVTVRNKRNGRTEILNDKGQVVKTFI